MAIKFNKGTKYFDSLGVKVWTFNIPSGFTCPAAKACLTYANRETGEISKGKHNEFTCYSARAERHPSVRKRYWENLMGLWSLDAVGMFDALWDALPNRAENVRVHVAGDFFSEDYFKAWLGVAGIHPNVRFWTYTKSLDILVSAKQRGVIPENFNIVASYGGTMDHLIKQHNLQYGIVVKTEDEAAELGIPVDNRDYYAMMGGSSFAMIQH